MLTRINSKEEQGDEIADVVLELDMEDMNNVGESEVLLADN